MIIILANKKHVIDFTIIFDRHPKGAIFFSCESHLIFYFWSPFRWMIAPITLPFVRSPWISDLYYSEDLILTIKNFSCCYDSISMAWNNSQLFDVVLIITSFAANSSCNNVATMISLIYQLPIGFRASKRSLVIIVYCWSTCKIS